MNLHQQQTHPVYVDGCFGCKVGTLTVNTSTAYRDVTARERALRADLDAYKRLRQDGLQPPNVDGAAQLEATSTHRLQVEEPRLAAAFGVK